MSKKTYKSQASSARAASGAFGQGQGYFGNNPTTFGGVASSPLSYVYEPPVLTGISDPNVIVAFKNVQKKDGTTKTKALEDLQSHVELIKGNTIEEAVLEAWIKVYPRTSIDSSRRVRQLAHIAQGRIATSCGKRLAKYMPDIVPSWLAGQQDPDRVVSRAARDSYNQVFTTEEKSKNVWRVYHRAVMEYVENAFVKETENTLSDMRTTNPDDAAAKYSRVVGCAVTLLTGLLELVDMENLNSTTLATLVGEESLWKLANHDDAFVRRAIFRLLLACLETQPQFLQSSLLSTYVVNEGLHTDQMGSSLDFIKALVRLSEVVPTVWTSNYKGMRKISTSHRLLEFLRRGSQGGSVEFWSYVPSLLRYVANEIVFTSQTESNFEPEHESSDSKISLLLGALRAGITSKDESQSNAASAWSAYLDVCENLGSMKNFFAPSKLLQNNLFPLIYQFIKPSPDFSQWTIAGSQQQIICVKACGIAIRISLEIFDKEWRVISSKLIEDFQTSLPQQSKDHAKSQDSIAAEGLRWYRLHAALIDASSSEPVTQAIRLQIMQEIKAAISVLTTRDGKPYGVAAALQALVKTMPQLVLNEIPAKDTLLDFARNKVPHLMISPSATYLIQLLDAMEGHVDARSAYMSCIESIESSLEFPAGKNAMRTLLLSPGAAKAGLLSTHTNKILARAIENVVKGGNNDLDWNLMMSALQNPSAPKDLTDRILSILTEGLSTEDSSQASLCGLEFTTKHNRKALSDFATHSKGSDLIAKLLFLSEGPDMSTSQKANEMMREIEDALEITGDTAQNTRPLLTAIQKEFRIAGIESLTIESLVSQAERLLKQTLDIDLPFTISELLPKSTDWKTALEPFITRPLNPSLAIANPFGTAIVMIQPDPGQLALALPTPISRDQDGRSVLLRILQYVTKLVEATELLSQATEDQRLTLLHYITVSLQLAGDNINVSSAIPLWVTEDPDIEVESAESIFEAQRLLAYMLHAAPMSRLISRILAQLLQDSEGSSSSSYFHARAYLSVIDELAEPRRQISIANSADRIKAIHKSPNLFTDMAVLMSCDGKEAVRPCNELLSYLTEYKFEVEDAGEQQKGLHRLILMNCLLQRSDEIVLDIPQQRLIFYVQHVIGEAKVAPFESAMETIRSLTMILPAIKGIYGSFWGEALDFARTVQQYPFDDRHLMGYHACFKLCVTLIKPYMLEANDDLLDAWTDRKHSIMQGSIRLLEKASMTPDDTHLPRRIFNELLSRLLAGSGQILSGETETLFPVLASESATLQRIAFDLLHEQIPSKQEQISLDKALTKDYEAKIPEELLSLILAPPPWPEVSVFLQRVIPASLRSYLLSWVLVFDHWKNASNILQIDYAKSLAEGTYLTDLLNLTFTILIGARGKAVDISKFDIEAYNIDVEPPERDTYWLLSHLYFLCLKYLPTQSKTWWRDTTSRQTNITVEAWTQRYVSKYIIACELEAMREWGPTQTTGDQPLTIKVLSSAREITASIPVDEQTMVLAIRLPPSYPLARAEVEGVHRVGVPEKKWTSWIHNTQGQLTIASEGGANALIDCLQAWRKNVTATMKGQTECAICYSVVGVDRTLPSKVCKTCKNKFHGSCLFRWFSSSNSSSCPLCRNTFTYS